ncbi:related to STB3 SIN3 protein-binding protein [Cephalotrichum gorgonifer]|uniref:Related to STB3 SIN3 protein-binding protein n=1 Tax=Cephalotrichum gorgonifer TaxID=2041049 RepID=A0AAE8MWA4_9PEZI|nr:related to STB3 SIN3 protein-binding protein [Cephalotrichum gorgonifer]
MASPAYAVRDIPKASLSRDNLTVVAARSVPGTVTQSQPLPTPPNSISPGLPPHGLKAQLQNVRLDPIDSDLDLHDAHPGRDGSPSPAFECAGTITSAMLAKYHLPEIMLNHGPLAIRHIMGYLTTSVPGFAGIPPTKARRLVVGALEGRGGEGRGADGDVEFEKVGWGRWDARRRGQPSRSRRSSPSGSRSPPYSAGIPISKKGARAGGRSRLNASSSMGGSVVFSYDDHEISMAENEADKMSLDDSASASCSEAPDDDMMMRDDDPDDVTDDEDWAAIGAAALRADSYTSRAAAAADGRFASFHGYSGGGMRSFSATAGMARSLQPVNIDASALEATSDAQEREAVEALLQLRSV